MSKGERYEWQPGMREISGFGGAYEQACRRMVQAGCFWLEDHPDAKPEFRGYKNILGVVSEENDDAKALSEAIAKPVPDCSGAMHAWSVNACMFVRKNGWPAYVAGMSTPVTP